MADNAMSAAAHGIDLVGMISMAAGAMSREPGAMASPSVRRLPCPVNVRHVPTVG